MDLLPLLSKNTLVQLGMLRIEPRGKLENKLRIKKVEQREANDLEELLNEYKEVFKGVGCIPDNKTGKEIEVKLEMDSDAIPVAQKPRHVLYHLQQPPKEWLQLGVKEKIFEKKSIGR